MTLKVLGSGSDGNCYILDAGKEALVIEAGIRFAKVKKALGFNIRKIVGVVASHGHCDHVRYLDSYKKAGIRIFKPYDSRRRRVDFGRFHIEAFPLIHNVPCYGFFITHPEMGNLVYASDTEYIRNRFTGKYAPNHILVEANYDEDLLDRAAPNYAHVRQGHMSIQTAVEFLKANDNPKLMSVTLIHLSDKNADPELFLKTAEKVVSCPVWVARPGLVVEMGKEPF